MPTNPNINRYRDLLDVIPQGIFYDREGVIVPYRTTPYELRFTTETPNRKFGVFLNGVFIGTSTTDAVGNLVVSVLLALGENKVQVIDSETQARLQSFLTTRHYATWMAAIAAGFEQVDDYVDEVRLASALAESPSIDLEPVWGQRTRLPTIPGWDVEAYREGLEAVHQAQRLLEAKLGGHEAAVQALCAVPPLDFYRLFDGKRWVLGHNFLRNGTFSERSHQPVPTPSIPGIVVEQFSPLCGQGGALLSWNPGTQEIGYFDPFLGLSTVTLLPGLDGLYEIQGPPVEAARTSISGPFAIVAGVNDQLDLDVDGRGALTVTLPAGGAVTALQVVLAINAALVADVRYGVLYGGFAGIFGAATKLRLRCTTTGPESRISVLAGPQSAWPTVFGLAAVDLPMTFRGYSFPKLAVRVTQASLPAVAVNYPFTIYWAPWSDGWLFRAGSMSLVSPRPRRFEHTITELDVTTDATNEVIFERVVELDEVDRYRGFSFRLGAWLQTLVAGVVARFGWSFDGGVTWNEGPPQALTQQEDPFEPPQYITGSFLFDPDTTGLSVRMRLTSGAAGDLVRVHEVRLDQPEVTAAFLASNTVARSRHRSFYGHLLWAWCRDPLSVDEQKALGLTSPPWGDAKGQIDFISAAHTQIDRFNVTNIEIPTGEPINLKGIRDEATWSTATLTNLAIVPRAPSRFTHVVPTVAGLITSDPLAVNSIVPHTALLTVASDEDLGSSVLLQDGVPLTQDLWSYTSSAQILIDNAAYSATSVYQLRYRALYQVVTGVIDLGLAWADYVWFYDHGIFQRYLAEKAEIQREVPLFLDFGTYAATLDRPANTDDEGAAIYRDDGVEKIELSRSDWEFSNAYTITLAGGVIKTGALYTLAYKQVGLLSPQAIEARAEIRSATTVAGVALAPWKPAARNRAVKTQDGLRYHQIRLTLTGIEDVRDLRLLSVVLKGLHLFGLGALIPGLAP
jgi:hypothetical protein